MELIRRIPYVVIPVNSGIKFIRNRTENDTRIVWAVVVKIRKVVFGFGWGKAI